LKSAFVVDTEVGLWNFKQNQLAVWKNRKNSARHTYIKPLFSFQRNSAITISYTNE